MKKYNVEICTEELNTPHNNIWDGDFYPDAIEAENEQQAIELAIDDYMERSSGKWDIVNAVENTIAIDYGDHCISYQTYDGEIYVILFRAIEEEN